MWQKALQNLILALYSIARLTGEFTPKVFPISFLIAIRPSFHSRLKSDRKLSVKRESINFHISHINKASNNLFSLPSCLVSWFLCLLPWNFCSLAIKKNENSDLFCGRRLRFFFNFLVSTSFYWDWLFFISPQVICNCRRESWQK